MCIRDRDKDQIHLVTANIHHMGAATEPSFWWPGWWSKTSFGHSKVYFLKVDYSKVHFPKKKVLFSQSGFVRNHVFKIVISESVLGRSSLGNKAYASLSWFFDGTVITSWMISTENCDIHDYNAVHPISRSCAGIDENWSPSRISELSQTRVWLSLKPPWIAEYCQPPIAVTTVINMWHAGGSLFIPPLISDWIAHAMRPEGRIKYSLSWSKVLPIQKFLQISCWSIWFNGLQNIEAGVNL